jgi:hypothetical protein
MKIKNGLFSVWIFVTFLLGACNYPGTGVSAVFGPAAWFDVPLDKSMLPLEPMQVAAHAYDPSGVAEFELSVNGSKIGTSPPSDANGQLYMINTMWTPPGFGNYTLAVRAHSSSGAWGPPVNVVVSIGNPTLTSTPTLLPSPTGTSSPSVTPTVNITTTSTPGATATKRPLVIMPSNTPAPTNTPKPTSDAPKFKPDLSTQVLYVGTCTQFISPDAKIDLNVSNSSKVVYVKVYYSFHPKKGNSIDLGNFFLTSGGDGTGQFSGVISMLELAKYIDPLTNAINGEFHYSFEAQDANEQAIGKSSTYKNLKVKACP